jgi:hypothetical protein
MCGVILSERDAEPECGTPLCGIVPGLEIEASVVCESRMACVETMRRK